MNLLHGASIRGMTAPPQDDPLVQMNVRVPASVKAAILARVEEKDMTLGRWVTNACRFALSKHGITPGAGAATATPPHRRRSEGLNL